MEQNSRDGMIVNDSSLLTTRHVLGKGKFGSVTLVGDSESRCYAKKTYPINHLDTLQKELNMMHHFHDNPNIIGAKSSVVHFSNNSKNERVCSIYMEYANRRTLKKMISEESHGKSLPEYTIQRLARMILQGLEALHADGYIHCDLKPSNILLSHSTTDEEPFDLKLAGFSSSKIPKCESAYSFTSMVKYRSPEACWRDEAISPADDIWSLGSIVYEMFGARPVMDLFHYDWILVEDISMVAKSFLRRCIAKEAFWATATELLNHPFITQKLNPPPPPPPSPSPTLRCTEEDLTKEIPKLPGSIW